ncbi:MAG: Gfo/Idh/MocA family oxidoreductase [Chloroflexi bacterium AL-W]|nr:Gfo/Idh/MocA family oxidoreductase [Chloroflexi bacterium AL-N1]NOK64755.1 Gfo/Idh/MocA family oxidoreductase [Chloroflexi bacterium AL-N10]NOK75996.1 Gfo/Idh/MocA family oxidoreductase [Chloroflexi bacterium AL-N5]NOK80245.1 Gfo/Idh/MocA family oxidoreductase [Chloroflexi bacterium AL-W]NOK86758.1 Gfo/Idh/MocA family oxidoreductase [Chloroflexi bacterium AL-N15]
MTSSPLSFAIVGTGMVARYHAEAIAQTPGAKLIAVCRSDAAGAQQAAEQFGVPCETNYEALLARPDVDVVCICTPSGMHAAQTIQAAQAGKHVLVEKPMALTLADADAMIRACYDANVQLGVVLQRRTDPTFSMVRASITAHELGEMVLGSVNVPYVRPQTYYDSAAWRGTWALDGGGALMNQGIHLVDLLLWYMGDVAEVHANFTTRARNIEVEDCVTATLRFASGALGSMVATTAAEPGFPHRVEVYGTAGGVQIEGETVVRWNGGGSHRAATTTMSGSADAGAGGSPTGISAVGHTNIVMDFVDAIGSGCAPLVPGAEGRRSLALVLAIYEAARSGQAVCPA